MLLLFFSSYCRYLIISPATINDSVSTHVYFFFKAVHSHWEWKVEESMTIRSQLPQVMMNLNHRERERVSRKTFLLTVARKNTHHACADVVIIAITWHLTHAWRWSKHCIEGTSRCIIIVPSFPQFLQSRLIFFICTRVTTLHPCYMKNALVFSQSDARYFFM